LGTFEIISGLVGTVMFSLYAFKPEEKWECYVKSGAMFAEADPLDKSDYVDVAARYHTIFIFGMIFYICSLLTGISRCFIMSRDSILVSISSIGAFLIILGQVCLVITATAVRFSNAGRVCSG